MTSTASIRAFPFGGANHPPPRIHDESHRRALVRSVKFVSWSSSPPGRQCVLVEAEYRQLFVNASGSQLLINGWSGTITDSIQALTRLGSPEGMESVLTDTRACLTTRPRTHWKRWCACSCRHRQRYPLPSICFHHRAISPSP